MPHSHHKLNETTVQLSFKNRFGQNSSQRLCVETAERISIRIPMTRDSYQLFVNFE